MRVVLHVVLPLVLGVLVYVAWRTTDVQLVTWLPDALVRALRGSLGRIPLPDFVRGSAPDAAWGWSFGAALALVWRGRPLRAKARWLAGGALVAAYAEVGQLWGLPPGRFDVIDLFAIVLGFAIGAAIASRSGRRSVKEPGLRDPAAGDGATRAVVSER